MEVVSSSILLGLPNAAYEGYQPNGYLSLVRSETRSDLTSCFFTCRFATDFAIQRFDVPILVRETRRQRVLGDGKIAARPEALDLRV
jgi:hypothetical protein